MTLTIALEPAPIETDPQGVVRVASNEQVETILYPLQVRTMSIMRDAFAPYPYGAPLPDQD